MATPSSVKTQSSELVVFTYQVKEQLAETLDLTQYQPLHDFLKSKLADLHLNHASVADQLSQEAQDEVLVDIDLAKTWKIKLLERINSLNQQPTATVTSKECHAKLPEIKLLTFSGNLDQWETFWSSFRNNVDSRDDLEQSAKLTYLLQSLKGEPREMISGLSHTDDNYRIALESLRDRYANPIQQTEVLLQKFFNLPSPHQNAIELRKFLTEYRKIREQMWHVQDFHSSNLVIRSAVLRKLPYQTYSEISDHLKNHNFNLQEMDSTLQYMIGKMEHGRLIMGDKANVNEVGAHSHSQSSQGCNFKCPFCVGNHKAVDCNKYKSIQARKDRVIAQILCFNCLTPGHSSKQCRSKKTCHICTYIIILHFAISHQIVVEITHNPLKLTSPQMLVVSPNNNNHSNNIHTHEHKYRINNHPWLHNINPTQTNSMLLLLLLLLPIPRQLM